MAREFVLVYPRSGRDVDVVVSEHIPEGVSEFDLEEVELEEAEFWLGEADVGTIDALCERLDEETRGRESVRAYCLDEHFQNLLGTLGLDYPLPDRVRLACAGG
jgi:hypothetical protein